MKQEKHPVIRTAALYYNRRRPEALEKTLEAARILHEAGVSVCLYAPEEHSLPDIQTRPSNISRHFQREDY